MTTLTPLGIAALALLAERPMHPYEMYQLMLLRREDRNLKVRPGSLYHVVDRLAEAGLVEALGVERSGNRPERTSYAITDAGRRALESRVTAMLETPAEEYPEVRVAMGKAHNLPADTVARLLTERRRLLATRLADLDAAEAAVTAKGLPRRFWLDLNYNATILRADIAWLDTVISETSDGTLSWTEPIPHA